MAFIDEKPQFQVLGKRSEMNKPNIKTYRRAIQFSVAVAFILIPWLNHIRINIVYGNFLSFHFYKLPLADPLAVLQITLKNNYFSADLLIGAAIALVIAAILGTVFCSWICPFGMLSEWGQALTRWRNNKTRQKSMRPHRWGFIVKSVIFIVGLTGFFLFSTTPILNQLSLPAWYSRIFQFWFEQWHISMAIHALFTVIIVETVLKKRIWCRYICPQSVLITLAKQLNPSRLKVAFDPQACICMGKHNDPCTRSCNLNLDPKRLTIFPETECTNCGDCVVACQKRGQALSFQFGRQVVKSLNQ